jgi:hypothetical protein
MREPLDSTANEVKKMLRTILSLITVLVVASSMAAAEIVEIPLPGLLGIYPITEMNVTRTVTFQLPAAPLIIHGASFRISGSAGVGAASCEWGGSYPWPMDILASMKDTPFAHFWIASALMPVEASPFGWTAEFHATPSTTTWGFLMDGEAEISLSGAPSGLVDLCWPVTEPPTANVTEAVLIVDAEFPVPVEGTNWGRIKALYESP